MRAPLILTQTHQEAGANPMDLKRGIDKASTSKDTFRFKFINTFGDNSKE